MIKQFPFIIALLAFGFTQSQNQKEIDSLLNTLTENTTNIDRVNTYIDIAEEYKQGDSINTLKYANKAIELANSINYIEGSIDALYPIAVINVRTGNLQEAKHYFSEMQNRSHTSNYLQGEATALYGLGRLSTYQGKNDEGLKYILQSLEIREKLGVKSEIALNHNMIGHIYMKKSNYDKALKYYLKSLKINEEIGNRLQVGIVYNNIGIIYKNQDNIDKAIENYNKSLEILKEFGRNDFVASNLTNIGNLYLKKGEPQKALEYQLEALELKKKFPDKREIAFSYEYIGQTYLVLKDYPKALNYAEDALTIYQNLDTNSEKASALILIGEIYKEENQLLKARKYLKEGLQLAEQEGLLGYLREGAKQLSIVEKKLGNYKNAFEAQSLHKQMADSINNKENIKKITRLQTEYEFQKKSDSLQAAQQKELLLVREKNKRNQFRNISIGVCLLLLLITGIVVYISVIKTKRAKEFVSLREHISQDLHDEIGSTLSSISLYGTVASKNIIDDPEKANQLLSRINHNATQTIESINDIVWAIKSGNDTLNHLVNRMRSFASEMQETGEWDIQINHTPSSSVKVLDMIQRRNIYLIFKEAINNAIKYSKGNTIAVDIKNARKSIIMEIKDNGIGFDLENIDKNKMLGGNGLNNMKTRAEELGGILEIISKPDSNGTLIRLNFSL